MHFQFLIPWQKYAAGIVLSLILTFLSPVAKRSFAADEYQVKVAFLYSFAKFVQWPGESSPNEGTSFIFSFISRDSLLSQGAEIENRTIRGLRTVVRYPRTPEEIDVRSRVLFIHHSMEDESGAILERLKNNPVLIVGDEMDLARRGGTINLIKSDNKIRFEVNIDEARRTGLTISSELLQLARIVTTKDTMSQ